MRISDWSSDVCSSDLGELQGDLARSQLHGLAEALQRLRIAPLLLIDQALVVHILAAIGVQLDRLVVVGIGSVEIMQQAQRVGAVEVAAGEAGLELHRRSEEHTSELQSLMRISYAVFCLKKKK